MASVASIYEHDSGDASGRIRSDRPTGGYGGVYGGYRTVSDVTRQSIS